MVRDGPHAEHIGAATPGAQPPSQEGGARLPARCHDSACPHVRLVEARVSAAHIGPLARADRPCVTRALTVDGPRSRHVLGHLRRALVGPPVPPCPPVPTPLTTGRRNASPRLLDPGYGWVRPAAGVRASAPAPVGPASVGSPHPAWPIPALRPLPGCHERSARNRTTAGHIFAGSESGQGMKRTEPRRESS